MNEKRVAILSDIHGNSIALHAVLADIERRGRVDAYWLIGDYVALGHDPVGVMERITKLPNAVYTRGNTDRYLVTGELPFPSVAEAQNKPDLIQIMVEMNASFGWTQGAISVGGWLDWLAGLPLEFRTTLPDGTRFLGVHAAPGTDDGKGIKPAMSAELIAERLADCSADLICVGHTHEPMEIRLNGRHLVNLGSVSNPKAPDLRASYALLTADESGYQIQLQFVEYDRQAVIAMLEKLHHPGRAYITRFMRGEIHP